MYVTNPQKEVWTQIYSYAARAVEGFGFLNYGYASDPPIALSSEDEPERYGAQLYDRVAGPLSLPGKRVVEVGCGRGAGADFLVRYRGATAYEGVDYTFANVALCRRRFGGDGRLRFLQGDADALGLESGVVDAVMNVESSHCYESRVGFFREVRRVLAPGGFFLYADFWGADFSAADVLKEVGFSVESCDDITEGVLTSLRRDSGRRRMIAEAAPDENRREMLASWAGVEGLPIFEQFRRREFVYWAVRARA